MLKLALSGVHTSSKAKQCFLDYYVYLHQTVQTRLHPQIMSEKICPIFLYQVQPLFPKKLINMSKKVILIGSTPKCNGFFLGSYPIWMQIGSSDLHNPVDQ